MDRTYSEKSPLAEGVQIEKLTSLVPEIKHFTHSQEVFEETDRMFTWVWAD